MNEWTKKDKGQVEGKDEDRDRWGQGTYEDFEGTRKERDLDRTRKLQRKGKDKNTGAESEFWKCGGLVISVPATRSARPGLESRPGASPQSGVRGGRSLCEYCTNKLIKLGPGWL